MRKKTHNNRGSILICNIIFVGKVVLETMPREREQTSLVLDFLKKGNEIDSAEAMHLFRIKSLPNIIYRLRHSGYHIMSEYRYAGGRNGMYAVYYLEQQKLPS